MPVSGLAGALGYTFRDDSLLREALTHRSAGRRHNERLEYLGDAVLDLVIARALFHRRPKAAEGELSRLRSSLVKGETLAEVARDLGLGERLALGTGELKSGGHRRPRVLAGALEALFGAILLDGGFDACETVILRLYAPRIDRLPPPESLVDPKTRLQELLQARQRPLPEYRVLAVSGADHARRFEVECVAGEVRAVSEGTSRRGAEQDAARKALARLAGDG